jgi:hypothetical protein
MKTLTEIITILEKSDFKCIGGDLINFKAWIELKEKANDINSRCCLGAEHKCPLNVNDGCCAADTCQYKVKAI